MPVMIQLARAARPTEAAVGALSALCSAAARYVCGGSLFAADGASVYHNGSADLIDAELEGEHADVLLAGSRPADATCARVMM